MKPFIQSIDYAGQVAKVYRNLHRQCYSVQIKGKVVGHTNVIELEDVVFKVSQAGRARVIASGHKNVHAFVVGRIRGTINVLSSQERVSYNPRDGYDIGYFRRTNGCPMESVRVAQLGYEGVYIVE